MSKQPLFIFSKQYLTYRFHQEHPFNQIRLLMTKELLESWQSLERDQIIAPRKATDEELAYIHHPTYIEMVKKVSVQQSMLTEEDLEEASNFGLGTEDTPIFPDMHEAAAWIVGGTLTAAELIMQGKTKQALNLAGGLHHAFQGHASGFCIYNDCSVAIAYLRQKYNLKVMYIDTDAHHGDGVQMSFYDDPQVFTYSIHETGRYLFPGTGNIAERGDGAGYGFTLNLPMDAFTQDDSWLSSFQEGLETAAAFFKPDIILSQHGCDAHFYDPLTHLCCSMKTFAEMPKLIQEIANRYCEGRWIAVGGGGYDIFRVVPRAWSLLWLAMNNQSLEQKAIPKPWYDHYASKTPLTLPTMLYDFPEEEPTIPRKAEIEEKNSSTTSKALYSLKRQISL